MINDLTKWLVVVVVESEDWESEQIDLKDDRILNKLARRKTSSSVNHSIEDARCEGEKYTSKEIQYSRLI